MDLPSWIQNIDSKLQDTVQILYSILQLTIQLWITFDSKLQDVQNEFSPTFWVEKVVERNVIGQRDRERIERLAVRLTDTGDLRVVDISGSPDKYSTVS